MEVYIPPDDQEIIEIKKGLKQAYEPYQTREKAMKLLDGNYGDIERCFTGGLDPNVAFGVTAVNQFVFSQGSPFLSKVESIGKYLRRIGGVHSLYINKKI